MSSSEASNELRPRFADLQATAVIADFSAVTNADVAGSIVRQSSAAWQVVHSREEPFAALGAQDPKFDRVTLTELLGEKGDLPAR